MHIHMLNTDAYLCKGRHLTAQVRRLEYPSSLDFSLERGICGVGDRGLVDEQKYCSSGGLLGDRKLGSLVDKQGQVVALLETSGESKECG